MMDFWPKQKNNKRASEKEDWYEDLGVRLTRGDRIEVIAGNQVCGYVSIIFFARGISAGRRSYSSRARGAAHT